MHASYSTRSAARRLPLVLLGAAATSGAARAQVTFSIDHRGPTIAAPNTCDGIPITAGDILSPTTGPVCAANPPAFGPLPPPTVTIHGGIAPPGLGLVTWGGCVGSPPGAPCPIELDALSYGLDAVLPPGAPAPAGAYVFSVDEWAVGIAGTPLPPAVWSEGGAPAFDAAADAFASFALPPAPLTPAGPVHGHTALIDGNGLPSLTGAVYAGLGIFEPRPAFVGPGPRPGDNLDALDVDTPAGLPLGVFFSLDAGWPDPLMAAPNTGAGPANGFPPAAILNKVGAGAPIVWAPPLALGLDLFGPGTDDLDALAMRENGIPGYQPGADLYLFSVRRGSAVIGAPDSIFGAPIEPGDILVPPVPGGPPTPGIYIGAERIGLLTSRSAGVPFGDDLDALDVRQGGFPGTFTPFCAGDGTLATACPCGNFGLPNRGCDNSAATGGAMLSAVGTTTPDTVVLTSSGELATAFSVFLQGTTTLAVPAVFGDGVRCIGGSLKRLYTKPAVAGSVSAPTGADPSITVRSAALGDPIAPGSTRHYQVYYRDPVLGFCPAPPGDSYNISSAISIVW